MSTVWSCNAALNFSVINMNKIESVIVSSGEVRKETERAKTKTAAIAAKELLKNGILVETKKGLICMSLKDALNKGVGGHNLSVEDFQTVATKLLFQEKPTETLVPESAAAHLDNSLNPKKGHKLIKRTKISLNKIPVVSLVPVSKTFKTSQVNLKEFKDGKNTFVGFSSLEPSLSNKIEGASKENKKVTVIEGNTSKIGEIINKRPLVNKRSLIIKNNLKPVSTLKRIINKTESKPEIKSVASVLVKSGSRFNDNRLLHESYMSCGDTSDNSEVTFVVTNKAESKPVKKRGGWPKGRKRKPEIKYEIRPPKAPATGYVIFLNEKRKDYKDMPFTEVTKLLGNEWSKLSLQEKKRYLDQAEIEKKRYREELKAYRQSDAYQSYLHKKRLKRLQENGTEESDMDATDEIDEEDNEELYCRSCDQWFHSLHNKKEHLYGRQHLQSIAGRCTKLSDPDWCNANMSSTSLDESSLDGSSYLKANQEHCCNKNDDWLNMDDVIVRFMIANEEREEERKVLQRKLEESKTKNLILSQELQKLNEKLDSLTCMMESERTAQILLEQRLFNLLNVPTLFYLPEPLSEDNN